jgi:protein-L-isoaspartate(D-aspartate) O-methyltransferase
MDSFASPTDADLANQRMVDRLIAEGSLWSKPVIEAFRRTPRHRFLDRVFLYLRKHDQWREIRTTHLGALEIKILYSDRALVTKLGMSAGQPQVAPLSSSSQPSLMAEMLEDLDVRPGQSVLEVGAGTGYNAALLGDLVGPAGQVTSVDVDRATLAEAWVHLRAFPDRPVRFEHVDGRQGFAARAPYDRLIVTASSTDLEPAWLDQVADAGLLLVPIRFGPGLEYLVRGQVRQGECHGRLVRPAFFMPLHGEIGLEAATEPPRFRGEGQALPAPWADWFGKTRVQASWGGFSRALAFFGWLHGLVVSHHGEANGAGLFGLQEADSGHGCCLGLQEWRLFGGTAIRDRIWQLWRDFLEAGGPRPGEFRVRVGRQLTPAAGEFVYRGPQCQWRWQPLVIHERPLRE